MLTGYVQGMNLIAASLLYHAEEYIAFYMFKYIFDRLEMRDIYLPCKTAWLIDDLMKLSRESELPGLSKHVQLIDVLVLSRMPDLYSRFVRETS